MRPTPHKLLTQAKIPAFLVSDLTNIRYLTGLAITSGLLLVVPRRMILFTDDRYREMAERDAYSGISVRNVDELPAFLASVRRCGCETEVVTLAQMQRWRRKFPRKRFVPTLGVMQVFRRQKDVAELRHLKRAKRITEELLRRVPSALRKGMTEIGLARKLLLWALELGAEGLAFDPIVAFGTNTSRPHHHPTTRALKIGHLVQIDVGAKVSGYCADASEVFFTAKPTREAARAYQAISEAKEAAMEAVRPGITTHELDRIARKVLQKYGLEEAFVHSLGHGVGLEIHEGVSISQKKPAVPLLSNEVITIEPGVYFPGRFGMRVEEIAFLC